MPSRSPTRVAVNRQDGVAVACTCTIGSLSTYATRNPRVNLLGDLVHIPRGRNSGQQRSFAVIPGIRALIAGSLR